MIKFLKKLFSKTEQNKPVEIIQENQIEKKQFVTEEIPEFIPERDEEIFLINLGFKYSYGRLIKKKEGASIIYNLKDKTITIIKDGGTIVLLTGGNKSKIERFCNKYFI